MCFHNALSKTATEIEYRFDARFRDKTVFNPIYHGNGFTFLKWPVITTEAPEYIDFFNWGLIPFWVKSYDEAMKIRSLTLNAQGETLFVKPSFKYSVQQKRCLVLSSGFFEWQHKNGLKIPHFIMPKDGGLMAMGGVYSTWTDKQRGLVFNTFSVITTPANSLMAIIHNSKKRMPLIFDKKTEKLWLQPDLNDKDIAELIVPLKDNQLDARTISPLISKPGNNTNVPDVQDFYAYNDNNKLF